MSLFSFKEDTDDHASIDKVENLSSNFLTNK